MKLFGVLDLGTGMHGCRFSIGIRNSHDTSMRLAMTVGYRVFVCENMAFHGDFQPVLAKHSKNFSLTAALSIGVDEMQRNFGGMRTQVEGWRQAQLSDAAAKLIIYRAFIESDLEVPKHLAKPVHEMYLLSIRSTRNSSPGRCGAYPTPSLRRLRSWNRSRRSGPRPNSAAF